MKTKLLTLLSCILSATYIFALDTVVDGITYNLPYYQNCATLKSVSSTSTNVVIPSSITYNGKSYPVLAIDQNAFSGCKNITSITIPSSISGYNMYLGDGYKSVPAIGSGAFTGCCNLTTVTINSNSITSNGYYDNGLNGSSTIANIFGSQVTEYILGDNITNISSCAFSSCTGLTTLTIGNRVTSIGDRAFANCNISDIYFTGSVDDWCNKRWSPTQLSSNYTLYIDNEKVSDLVISEDVTSIVSNAFSGCSSLTSVVIPGSITAIGSDVFQRCENLKTISITNLSAFCNIDFASSSSSPMYYTHRLYIEGDEVTQLVIPNNVTSINNNAFYTCNSLTSVNIPNSVINIGSNIFNGCTYLEEITIGSGIDINGIGDYAFANCPYLLSVTCMAEYPPVINSTVFEGCGVLGGIDLYVPEESVKRYLKADVWSEFNIIGKDLGTDDPSNPTTDQFTITWQDEDGNVIKTDEVAQGATPAFTGTTPTKEGYTFAGWLPNIKPATEDTKYTTYFIPTQQQESKVYTVNINGENCSLNINNQYPEGTVITLEAVADECFEFQQWSDGNKENPRTVTVTANTNLTAEFNKVRYTITDKTEPGTGGKIQIVGQ